MSSNRLNYDTCAYSQKTKESKDCLNYVLFKPKYENSKKCKSASSDLKQVQKTVVENELFNLKRKSTLCSSKKFNSKTAKKFTHTPPAVCESIYYITPSNLKKTKSNGLPPINTKLDCCK